MDINNEEKQYLNLLEKVLFQGEDRDDRTGIGTKNVFGEQLKFNLRTSFPLLTTKKVFWKGVVEELLWFISGSTDVSVLNQKGVKIWNKNAESFYTQQKLFKKNDLGPIYGFQWRHYGEDYIGCDNKYGGIDQLKNIITTIQNKPLDRRMILLAWNPKDNSKMALPPCHCIAHFDVSAKINGKRELSCHLFQRSADMGLGVPFNIASYALLTHIIAHVSSTDTELIVPGDFVHTLSNIHIYKNHIRPLTEQISRIPRKFPTLEIRTKNRNIDRFSYKDFVLKNYNPYPSFRNGQWRYKYTIVKEN